MPFNPNIPQPNDDLSDSQLDLLNNNGFLNASFGVDHFPFSDATINNGKHTNVTTPNLSASPPVTGAITGATNAPICSITSPAHGLTTGSIITISGVGGMVQLNGNTYTITNTGVNTFNLNGVDSRAFGVYTAGGTWVLRNHPVTTTDPKFYGMQDSANVGIIQYSRGPNGAVPTPVTTLQSPAAPITLGSLATTNVLDFTGLSKAYAVLYATNLDFPLGFDFCQAMARWNGTNLITTNYQIGFANRISSLASGNVLQVKNLTNTAMTQVFWTLQLIRIQ